VRDWKVCKFYFHDSRENVLIQINNERPHLRYLGFTEYYFRTRSTGDIGLREEILNFLKNSGKGYFNYTDYYPYLIVSIRGTAEMQLALRYGEYIDDVIKPQKERVK